jgi:drug/metabolite transporter (DMT)-like permease
MASPDSGRLLGAFCLLTLIWGTTWAAIRLGLAGIPPFTGVALRFLIAGLLLLALARVMHVRFTWSRREIGLWIVNGALSFCASYGIVYWSEQYIPSGLAAVLFATYPIFVAAFAHVALPGERLGWAALAGTLLGFAGVAVIFSDDLRLLGGASVRVAAAVMLGSPLVSAVAMVAVKRWGAGIHPISLSAAPMLLCAAVMGLVAFVVERDAPVVYDVRSVGALLYLAVLGSAVTFTIYYWMLSHVSATRLALVAYTIPIVAVIVGAVLFAEPVRPKLLVGGALVLVGVALVHRRRAAA